MRKRKNNQDSCSSSPKKANQNDYGNSDTTPMDRKIVLQEDSLNVHSDSKSHKALDLGNACIVVNTFIW